MTQHDSWAAGVPCWTDLMTPDPQAVAPFYAAVLGWELTTPDAQYGGYVMAERDGRPVAGVGPMQPGARTAWTLYFASEDADATAAAVTANGGTLLAPVADVGPLGRMFVATDPTGAVFGVWQAGTFAGAALANEPGALTWEDLRSTDPGAAQDFYAAVFGFGYEAVDMAPADYRTFAAPGDPRPCGGIGGFMGDEQVPSHWLVYFAVADMAVAVAGAQDTGGAVPIPPFESPYGLMAGMTDPAGAGFWVVQVAQPAAAE